MGSQSVCEQHIKVYRSIITFVFFVVVLYKLFTIEGMYICMHTCMYACMHLSIYLHCQEISNQFFQKIGPRRGTEESPAHNERRKVHGPIVGFALVGTPPSVGFRRAGGGRRYPVGFQKRKDGGRRLVRLFQVGNVSAFLDPLELGVGEFLDKLRVQDGVSE